MSAINRRAPGSPAGKRLYKVPCGPSNNCQESTVACCRRPNTDSCSRCHYNSTGSHMMQKCLTSSFFWSAAVLAASSASFNRGMPASRSRSVASLQSTHHSTTQHNTGKLDSMAHTPAWVCKLLSVPAFCRCASYLICCFRYRCTSDNTPGLTNKHKQ